MSLSQGLTDMINPVVQKAGFRLWELKVTKAGKRSVVTITLDKAGGATLDEIAEMSKLIAPVLDENPSLEDAYHLEVASPGLERPLVTPEHFSWSLGMDITVSHRVDGSLVRSRGKLTMVSDKDITVETGDEENSVVVIEFADITKAHTLFDFDNAMKNGPITNQDIQDTDLDREGELTQ